MPRSHSRRYRPLAFVLVACAAVALLAPAFTFARDEVKKSAAAKEANEQPKEKDKQAGNSFMWKVTPKGGGGKTLYLLGSIHVARQDFYPLAPEIEEAFADSKVLAVEVDIQKADQGAMQQLMLTKGTYQDGSTLEKNLSKETYDAFRKHCQKNGLPAEQLGIFRPWAVALTLTVIEMQQLGFVPTLGIDYHFLTKAHEANIPVVELETAEQQLELLSGMGKEMEEKFLLSTLVEMANLKETMEMAATAWKTGDVKRLKEEMIDKPLREEPAIKPVMVKMLDERNVKMVEKIEEFLKGDEQHFVIVGAGHMVGDKGIVKLLQDKGHKVEQIRVTAAGEGKKRANP